MAQDVADDTQYLPPRKHDFYTKKYRDYPDLTLARAKEVGDEIGVDFSEIDLGEFRQGIKEEMEHGSEYGSATKVHEDDYVISGRIALAHLIEVPDYYQRLEDLEDKGEEVWGEGATEKHRRKAWAAKNYAEMQEILTRAGITNLPAAS